MPPLLLLAALLWAPAPAPLSAPAAEPDLVVLVHGLGRTRLSMLSLEWELEKEGYDVLNWGYGSTTASLARIGADLAASVDSALVESPGRRVHFVGHSLGSIVVRWVLANRRPEGVGRVVMLAPPNQGAQVADRFAPWLGWLLKPLPELTTGEGSTVRSLPAARGVEVGIVAGEHDEKVALDETALPGADELVIVPSGHTFIMARDDVKELVVRFLRSGSFAPAGGGSAGGGTTRRG